MSDMIKEIAMLSLEWPEKHVDEYLDYCEKSGITPHLWNGHVEKAEKIIAAATPHIRATLFDELIAWAEENEFGVLQWVPRDGLPIEFEYVPASWTDLLQHKKEQDQP